MLGSSGSGTFQPPAEGVPNSEQAAQEAQAMTEPGNGGSPGPKVGDLLSGEEVKKSESDEDEEDQLQF